MFRRFSLCFALTILLLLSLGPKKGVVSRTIPLPDLYEASISELQDGLERGHFTSVDLVRVRYFIATLLGYTNVYMQAYFARIDEVNHQGPTLRAVIETNPSALKQAEALDRERRLFGPRSRLHGIPILLKDNIATLHEEGKLVVN